MTLLSHLASLRDHGEWADLRLLDAVRATSAPLAVRELAHVRGAQDIWLSRIEQRTATLSIWPDLSVDQLATVGAELDVAWRNMFSALTEHMLELPVTYTSLAGDPYITPLGEILMHVMLHGHYHRGKANAALTAANGTAVSLDYILWWRSHGASATD